MARGGVAEDHRVRFIGFGPSSLDLEVAAYLMAPDHPAGLAIREELNLAVMEIVRDSGTDFAFPSTSVYLEPRDRASAAGRRAA
ncbi:MAG: hypothetical protein ACU0BS_07035 [Hasllibacter sp.]